MAHMRAQSSRRSFGAFDGHIENRLAARLTLLQNLNDCAKFAYCFLANISPHRGRNEQAAEIDQQQ
jgi:hypothetical protein